MRYNIYADEASISEARYMLIGGIWSNWGIEPEDEYLAVAASQVAKNALAPTLSGGKLAIRSVWVSVTSGASAIKYTTVLAFLYKEFL